MSGWSIGIGLTAFLCLVRKAVKSPCALLQQRLYYLRTQGCPTRNNWSLFSLISNNELSPSSFIMGIVITGIRVLAATAEFMTLYYFESKIIHEYASLCNVSSEKAQGKPVTLDSITFISFEGKRRNPDDDSRSYRKAAHGAQISG